jgi:twitching motility two-component system response regulator PilH
MTTKVLVVDDSTTSREILEPRLARKGSQDVTVRDGIQRVQLCKRELPDVLLIDLRMPVIDGREATRPNPGHELTAQIPVRTLTAYRSSPDRSAAMDAGASDLDLEPISMPRLTVRMPRLFELEPADEYISW